MRHHNFSRRRFAGLSRRRDRWTPQLVGPLFLVSSVLDVVVSCKRHEALVRHRDGTVLHVCNRLCDACTKDEKEERSFLEEGGGPGSPLSVPRAGDTRTAWPLSFSLALFLALLRNEQLDEAAKL